MNNHEFAERDRAMPGECLVHYASDDSGSPVRSSQVTKAHRYSDRVLGAHKYRQLRR